MSCSEEPDIEGPEYMLRPASFSVQTCLELINSGALSIHQINRESKLLLHPKIIEALPEVPVTRSISSFLDKTNPKGPLPAALEARQTFLIDKLKQFFECLIDDNFVDFRKGISTLTFNLARDVQDANKRASEASAQLENLKKNIQEAQELVESLNTRVTEAAPPPQLSSTPQRETVTIVSEPPYKILESRDLFSRFEVSSLRDEFVFDGLFSNRGTAYYGDVPYKYPGGSHPARRLPSTSLSTQFIRAVRQLCVENKLRFEDYNSCMVTLYEGPESCIPAHSDNEPSLIPDSSILTVSIGGTRNIQFRQRSPGQTRITLESLHGSCYLMTRSSQDLFTHEVLKPTVDSSPRMSFTFRSLRPATSAQSAPSAPRNRSSQPPKPSSKQHPGQKRVLILSDSKNRQFDCSRFRSPRIAVERKDLFLLRDLREHRDAISKADIVLISAGVNDLRRTRVGASTLLNHLRDFTRLFPRTKFLFDSVSPLAMRADRFNSLNREIDNLNESLFRFSLQSSNFKLFENTRFSLAHLSSDGIHLTKKGQLVLSESWVGAVLINLGLWSGSLPIRRAYRNIYERYSLKYSPH